MSRVRFTLPQVKDYPDSRPSACPHCRSVFLNRHGKVTKRVTDLYISEVSVIRYRCTDCLRTFRHYPEGVDRHDQSLRLRGLAALGWALGLSLRSVSHLLAALGCRLSRMSVWRDVQESGSGALSGWLNSARGHVRVVGADETVVRLRGKKTVVGVCNGRKERSTCGDGRVGGQGQRGLCEVASEICEPLRNGGDGDRRPVQLQAGGRAFGC